MRSFRKDRKPRRRKRVRILKQEAMAAPKKRNKLQAKKEVRKVKMMTKRMLRNRKRR